MNTHELVSVIICTRDRASLVSRAIDSVLAQEGVNLEIIVVDDCSSDGTYEVLTKRYEHRIKVIRLDRNRRVAYATNKGFATSVGEYIALLGDDDYWIDSKKLAKQLSAFRDSADTIGVVGTWWQEKDGAGNVVLKEPKEPRNWQERLLLGGGVICGSTPLITREAWTTVGGLDERMPRGTDSDLFRRIVLAGYRAKIVAEHTTVVDVGHGLVRMTSARGLREAKRHALANGYLLWKYRKYYLRYPKALVVRVKALVLAPLRAIV